jgi:hypothetical protein
MPPSGPSPPQVPSMQGRPQQFAPGKLQKAPKGRHTPPSLPHTPPTQGLSQHTAPGKLQELPSGWHMPPSGKTPQIPSLQGRPQQFAPGKSHEAPKGRHAPPSSPQIPSALHAVQHGRRAVHGMPSGSQVSLVAHTPPSHTDEQHCVGSLQAAPIGWHDPPQTPPPQIPSQHWEPTEQLTPSELHVGEPPLPPLAPLPDDAENPSSLRPQLAMTRDTPSRVASMTKSQA